MFRGSRSAKRSRRLATVAVAALVITAAACGSSSSSKGSSTAPSGSDKQSGPIKIMVISTLQSALFGFPEAVDGAKAAVAKVNASGGINGQQVQILSCNDNFDPNTAAACAQKAVSEKVTAVVTGYTSYGANMVSLLEAAKIPWIGSSPGSSVEWN